MSEFSGLDDIIKLGGSPALDPLILEGMPFSKLDWAVERVIGIIKYRLHNSGVTDYEIVVISHSDLPLTLKDIPVKEREIRTIDEDNLPPKTLYILTTKIGDRQTIKPADNIDWQEFFIQIMFGKKPQLSITPLWTQARITFR